MPSPSRAGFFRGVTLSISSSLKVGEALSATFNYLRNVIPVDRMGLYYYDRERAGLYAVAEATEKGAQEFDDSVPWGPLDKAGQDFLWDKLRLDPHVVVGENPPPTSFPFSLRGLLLKQVKGSILVMYLRIKGNNLGIMSLFADGKNRYTEDHARLLETVQRPIAIAMSNARLYRETLRLQHALADDNRALSREIQSFTGSQVVGADFGLRHVMEMVRHVAPLGSPVLLLGETGTGKEVIANVIHLYSPRQEKPMIRVQCGAIPDALLSSELFGHEKGAFTGAFEPKRGRFERADGGSIFLDEIGELTPEAQVKLLRVLQEKEFERLGSEKTIKVDVRIIAATHRNLEEMVQAGKFREDLWFRLNVFPIHLPPLRHRKEDIPSLVQYFVERKSSEMGLGKRPRVAEAEIGKLVRYDWPGNVRELQNVVERAIILNPGSFLGFDFLEASRTPAGVPPPDRSALQDISSLNEVVSNHIRLALRKCRGRVEGPRGAAGLLKVHPSTLRSKMMKLGIPTAP